MEQGAKKKRAVNYICLTIAIIYLLVILVNLLTLCSWAYELFGHGVFGWPNLPDSLYNFPYGDHYDNEAEGSPACAMFCLLPIVTMFLCKIFPRTQDLKGVKKTMIIATVANEAFSLLILVFIVITALTWKPN